ncbi:LysR family transcriptional regulator [Pantoea sp. BAV 3049]|uniref:LysR family transcriptional regulator n=1 Tax=Pantoea sp. BAV 3049 TaxID=2654188 RepID=UPI00131CEEE8|nr:LysR family transcriptional regulator [Pantoea sp. BAV 3049]
MTQIRFTLAQIEAFACVCEAGNITRAAKRLKKDRTTVRELLEYLEVDMGYPLFDRRTRPLQLTEEGQRLYRQARLFLQEAEAFSLAITDIPQQLGQKLTLCYDPFTPRDFLTALATELHLQGFKLDLLLMEREAAEEGLAELAICQALNRSISDKFKWRAIGSIELAVFAAADFFTGSKPVSLFTLASCPQLLPFHHLPESMKQRLQIADNIRTVSEISLLQRLLSSGQGWAFLPTHFAAGEWPHIRQYATELGQQGLLHPMVALWKPGACPVLNGIVEKVQRIYAETGRYTAAGAEHQSNNPCSSKPAAVSPPDAG